MVSGSNQVHCVGIFFLDTDYTDGHGLGLYSLNNGAIVQTMLPFHKCIRIYEIKNSEICGAFQAVKAQSVSKIILVRPEGVIFIFLKPLSFHKPKLGSKF